MKKNITIPIEDYNIELITNGKEEFDNVVLCFHGFNGDKWGEAYGGLRYSAETSLVCSFDSAGHGKSNVPSEKMRLDIILKEIDSVVNYLKQEAPNKPLVFVAGSYGAYRVFQYLIKYKPEVQKIIYVNPAFRMLEILECLKEFKYLSLKENELVKMKGSLNKFMTKEFLDDLFENNLYNATYNISYNTDVVVGMHDTLIPINDTLEIINKYGFNLSYVDDSHCFENKESWQVVINIIKEIK